MMKNKLLYSDVLSKAVDTAKYKISKFNKGKSESYLIKNLDGKTLAIFKPTEKDQPKLSGRYANAASEYCGYAVSKAFDLNIVPSIRMVTLPFEEDGKKIEKKGTLQYWFEDYKSASDISKSEYPKLLKSDVDKVVFLDFLIGNTDRHAGNLLVKYDKGLDKYKVRAIDHGLSAISKYGKISTVFNSFTFEGSLPDEFVKNSKDMLDYISKYFSFSKYYSNEDSGIIAKNKVYGLVTKRVVDEDTPSDKYIFSLIRHNYNALVKQNDVLYYVHFNDLEDCDIIKYYTQKEKELNILWLLKKLILVKKFPTWEIIKDNMS